MPVALKSSGGGSVTLDVPSTASTYTLTLPASTGTALTTATAVTVAQGGTGLATLTANNVVLGNGTGTPNFVAPGTTGNILTSNGTTWTSAAPASSGVTSLTAGNGITVSASTGAVTVSQNIYTGSTTTNTSYPVGTICTAFVNDGTYTLNQTNNIWVNNSNPQTLAYSTNNPGVYTAVTGTWRTRGRTFGDFACGVPAVLIQRVA
jgi:hypothetical protein